MVWLSATDPALGAPRPGLLQPHGGSLLRPRPGTTPRSQKRARSCNAVQGVLSKGRSVTQPQRGLPPQHPVTIPSSVASPLRRPQAALCLQPDPQVPDRRASRLFPGRCAHRVPTPHLPTVQPAGFGK